MPVLQNQFYTLTDEMMSRSLELDFCRCLDLCFHSIHREQYDTFLNDLATALSSSAQN